MDDRNYSKDDIANHFWKWVADAEQACASDIHFERLAATSVSGAPVTLRYRINGSLEDPVEELPLRLYEGVIAYLKDISGCNISGDGPGDGKQPSFAILSGRQFGGLDFNINCCIIPKLDGGRDIAIRIRGGDVPIPLEYLGLRAFEIAAVRHVPYGIILFSGPTGSGKLTTLSSILHDMKKNDKVKVWTISESAPDAFGYLNPLDASPESGNSYEDWMKIIVGQMDPDIVHIGSLKGPEKVPSAIDVALDGVAVVADMHANSAYDAILRYMDWSKDTDRRMAVDALATVACQKLMKRLCRDCKVAVRLEQDEIKRLLVSYLSYPENSEARLDADLIKATYARWVNEYGDQTGSLHRYEAIGCSKCNKTGYSGRVPVLEAVVVTPEMRKLISSNPDEEAIMKLAIQGGTSTLRQNAIERALAGTVDFMHIDKNIFG